MKRVGLGLRGCEVARLSPARRSPGLPLAAPVAGLLAWVAGILLVTGCASTPKKVYPPAPAFDTWTSVPAFVVDAVCGKLQSEGLGGTVDIVVTTEPIITRESLFGLAAAAESKTRENPTQVMALAEAGKVKLPLTIEAAGCELRKIASAGEARGDEMMLQLSPPFLNPYERKSVGLFARLSLGGHSSQWYWVPFGQHEGKWFAGTPLALAVPTHD